MAGVAPARLRGGELCCSGARRRLILLFFFPPSAPALAVAPALAEEAAGELQLPPPAAHAVS